MSSTRSASYREAGVDIDAQDRALTGIKKLARSTFGPDVLSEVGLFGGLFRLPIAGMKEPVLVASADGVGTKLAVAKRVGDFSTVGTDLVNHCVNDILVQGAKPLFFLDYIGTGVLDSAQMVDLVRGVRDGCRENGCALLGGELAEMPGLYQEGDVDLVGFVVGLVDRPQILDGSRVEPGDIVVGLPSTGLHTNGYSLARKVLFEMEGLDVEDRIPGTRLRVGETLMATHRSYLSIVSPALHHPAVHALAHITGGGISDNLPRVLPAGTHALVRLGCWEVPEIFHVLQERGGVATDEMFRVFNMGVGMILVVSADGLGEVLELLGGGKRGAKRVRPFVMGSIRKGGEGVVYDVETKLPAAEA